MHAEAKHIEIWYQYVRLVWYHMFVCNAFMEDLYSNETCDDDIV